ncbi:MAG: pyridoxal phosphate-dependent aminotransferase, partial [Planctomycetota bacterium]
IVVTTGRAAAVALLAAALEPAGRTVVLDAPIDRRMPALWSARGGAVHAVPRRLENGWRFEIERFEHALQAPSVFAAQLATPHDPTGLALQELEICRLAAAAERAGIWLLVDESARDLQPGAVLPVAAGLSPRVITLGSLAETHGLPGLRLAWLVMRDEALRARLLACDLAGATRPSVLDEAVALRALRARGPWREEQQVRLRLTRETVRRWAAGQGESVSIVVPETDSVALATLVPLAGADLDRWHETLRTAFGLAVAPGARFGLADHHVRIGYGALSHDDLVMGLAQLGAAVRAFAGG